MKTFVLIAVVFAAALPVWSEAQYGSRPVNTTQDVPTMEFS